MLIVCFLRLLRFFALFVCVFTFQTASAYKHGLLLGLKTLNCLQVFSIWDSKGCNSGLLRILEV